MYNADNNVGSAMILADPRERKSMSMSTDRERDNVKANRLSLDPLSGGDLTAVSEITDRGPRFLFDARRAVPSRRKSR